MTDFEWVVDGTDEFKTQLVMFLRALQEDDFAIGDRFWIGDIQFEVVEMTPEMMRQKGYFNMHLYNQERKNETDD